MRLGCGWVEGEETEGGCLRTSPPIVHFVISNLTPEPVCDWPRPPATRPPPPQDSSEPAMLRTKVGPPPIQAAINRGAEKPRGSQCNEIRPNQPRLAVFY